MKHYLFLIVNDGTGEKPSVYTYDNKNDAIAAFHKQLGGWMPKAQYVLAMVIRADGVVLMDETFYAEEVANAD